MSDVHAHPPVLLYDGECGFCARSVQFVLAHERPGQRAGLRFAPLQGLFGQAVLRGAPALAGVDSVVWFAPATGETLVRSDAGLAVLRHLGGIWGLLGVVGRLIPRPLRDRAYDLIARNRHRLAGVSCLVPTAEERPRFLS
jgi:predicted DCC family thiol-disulfide oxidoreductase YuxK